MQNSCRYIKLLVYTCFHFFDYKNYNVEAAITNVKLIIYTYFCFFVCKNCNVEITNISNLLKVFVFVFNL